MRYSLLYPRGEKPEYKKLSETAFHDIGMDTVCAKVGKNEREAELLRRIMSDMTADPEVAQYRCDVFDDIYKFPKLREQLLKLLEHVNFIKDYGIRRDFDEKTGIWELMHRLDEVNDYIRCVEDIHECLSGYDIASNGLIGLRDYVDIIYNEEGFAALKKDIAELNSKTCNIQSVTLGINLNSQFEAESMGLVSVNDRKFTRATMLSNFYDKLSGENALHVGTDWEKDYRYHVINPQDTNQLISLEKMAAARLAIMNPMTAIGMSYIGQGDATADITHYMDRIVSHMLHSTVTTMRGTLAGHVSISIKDITDLIPEFTYYVRWAEYIEKARNRGLIFSKAYANAEERCMTALGAYNIKLAESDSCEPKDVIMNNIGFDKEHRVHILTGANRGGKTTATQMIGQLILMAQGGIYVPASSFKFNPVDCIYTHFPADEDKTMDLGRLGEECRRFKELYRACTDKSLLLLNESFSTTSFEEGYFIACDAVKAILQKGIRTVYNTHMHKIAYSLDELNSNSEDKASSLVAESLNGICTYRIKEAPPEGLSYARTIAEKYGVTLEALLSPEEEDSADVVTRDLKQ